jgi:transposase
VSEEYKDSKVIIIMDNARYHHAKVVQKHIEELKNIEPVFLPPYCSDLNAIEHLWRKVRSIVTHNRLVEDFDDLVQNLLTCLDNLKYDPRSLKKLCAYIV